MFDKDSFAVTASSETDPDNVYWVSTPVRTFGDAQVDVSYTERGIVSGAKVTSSNPFVGFAVDVAGIVVKSAVGGFGADNVKAKVDGTWDKPTCHALTDPNACQSYANALLAFEKLLQNKAITAAGISAGNFDAYMKPVDADIEQHRQAFTGSVDITPSPKKLRWLPPGADTADKGCGTTKLGDSEYQGRCSAITIPACRVTDGVIAAAKKPVYRLTFEAKNTKASDEWLNIARTTLIDTSNTLGKHGRREDRGFPYRVPAIADVTVEATRYVDKDDKKEQGVASGAMTPVQLAIAQYGLVGRLTPRAGGRKGSVETKYFETGALQSVSVVREGEDPAPILDPIKEALQPKSSPSELDLLKAQKDYLEAQKAICVAAASLNTTPPDFCKLTGE